MTGKLTLLGSQYDGIITSTPTALVGALDCNNSNIINVNNITTCDKADSGNEGLRFWRSATTNDCIWAADGVLNFSPNLTIGATSGTTYTVYHSGNISSATVGSATTAQQLSGFSKRANANATWGTLVSANGYTPVYWVDTASSGGIGISDKDQRTYFQIDGIFYQNEGNYAVLDTNTGALKSHTHTVADLPVVTASKGGSGETSLINSANAYLNALSIGSSNPIDADYYISQYAGGGTTTTTYHRRPVSALYNYIKGKLDSVYAAAGHIHSGTGLSDFLKWDGNTSFGIRQWSTTTTNKPTAYGTVFDFKDPGTTWYYRLAFSTSGDIRLYTGINTTTMALVGKLSYDGHTHSNYAASSHTHSYLPLSGGTLTGNISYQGTNATNSMIRFLNNTSDAYGNGISIGGGGAVIIGGGEAASTCESLVAGGDEITLICSDQNIEFYSNCQSGTSTAKKMTYNTSGQLTAANFITSSDKRLKTNIHEISNAKKSLDLNFYEFDYKDNDNHSAGHIAQEVKEFLPEFVHEDKDEEHMLSIDYTGLHSIQIKALLDRIIKLEEEIKILKSSK